MVVIIGVLVLIVIVIIMLLVMNMGTSHDAAGVRREHIEAAKGWGAMDSMHGKTAAMVGATDDGRFNWG